MSIFDAQVSTKESVSAHFRIWKDVFDSLEDDARARQVSLNTLVNQVLSTYTREDLLFEKVGSVKMSKEAYRTMLRLVPYDKLGEVGTGSVKVLTELMLARKGAITLDGVVYQLHRASRRGWFEISEERTNGNRVLSLMHDFGPRHSILLGAEITSLFALVGVRPKVTTTDYSVTIEY